MAGCENATQWAIKAWSATLSCHVVSAAPFVLINCWEKCVTSSQADCWCPSGHPSVPAARWCYCGSDGRRGEPGPAGCETILGRKRRESRSCLQKPAQPSVSESIPLWLLPHPPLRIDFVILSPLYVKGMWDCFLSGFFTGFFIPHFFIWLASQDFKLALTPLFSIYKYINP